jgi:hypothetical protein
MARRRKGARKTAGKPNRDREARTPPRPEVGTQRRAQKVAMPRGDGSTTAAPAAKRREKVLPGAPAFVTAGTRTGHIDVRISYRIIDLFSEGLYRSPNKAVEELASNAFDAGATKTSVVLSPDLGHRAATIAVIDNGTGMDAEGLERHWLIGTSDKRDEEFEPPRGRTQIGKFGIGKLATYVLANRLSHVCRAGGKYYATTMNYGVLDPSPGAEIGEHEIVELDLRELTVAEAKTALAPWLVADGTVTGGITLFGKGAETSWTAAILSDLKDMATTVQRGRLRWILSTAMPLRDDFALYLDGERVEASKLKQPKLATWVLGKDVTELPKPAPSDLQVTKDMSVSRKSPKRYGLTHPSLGRVTGYAELYENLLTGQKSDEMGRSHGFFLYVHDRLVNLEDEYCGLDSNLLRHGTFSRFRMVLHADRLDNELRSSRESVREGPLLEVARNIMRGMFVQARTVHDRCEEAEAPGRQASRRIAATPASLVRRPLTESLRRALAGDVALRYVAYPFGLKPDEQERFLASYEQRAKQDAGPVQEVTYTYDLSQERGIAIYDAETLTLRVNLLHPYVAHYLDQYDHQARNVPLELVAMAEVLLEADLLERGLSGDVVHDIMDRRDELLRMLARASDRRNALLIAQDLQDAATNKDKLEETLVAAVSSLGFADAIRIGGKGNPDGFAAAHLPAGTEGDAQAFTVTLEAKSKEAIGAKVTAKTVGVSTVARHRDAKGARFALVVGPDFPASGGGESSALASELRSDREKYAKDGKGITVIRVADLARLVRVAPAKRVGLPRIRNLFEKCSTPEESATWVDVIECESTSAPPWRDLLEVLWDLQKELPSQPIEYAHLQVPLKSRNHNLGKAEIIALYKAVAAIAPEFVDARETVVELNQRPDLVLEAIGAVVRQLAGEVTRGLAMRGEL